MKAMVRALPVLYACHGCPEFGETAREVGQALEWNGVAEMVWLGAPDLGRRSRFPAVALDGCAKRCALQWLERHGIAAERSYALEGRGTGFVARAVRQITHDLGC